MTITITLKQLRDLDACPDQLKLFRETFGESVTFDSLAAFTAACQAHAFNYGWGAWQLLTPAARDGLDRACAAAWDAYARAIAAARADYAVEVAAARADIDRACAATWAEYDRAVEAAWGDYTRAVAPALVEYDRAIAAAFANAYWTQEH